MIKIEAYKAVCEWKELHKIESYKDGHVWDTMNTGLHIPMGEAPPKGHITVSISAKPGELVTINPCGRTGNEDC